MGSSDKDNQHLAKQYGLEHQVEISGYSPHTKALQSCVNSDLLLLFVGDEPRFKGIYTGKVFEYLRCGKPVLALAPKDGSLTRFSKKPGMAKRCSVRRKKLLSSLFYNSIKCGNPHKKTLISLVGKYIRMSENI